MRGREVCIFEGKKQAKKGELHFHSDLLDINKVPIRYVKPSFIYLRMDIAPANTLQSIVLKTW